MFLYRFFRIWLILLFNIFFGMKIKGKTYLPSQGGYIIASNHLSFLDPLVLGSACPRPLNFMARESLFRIKFFGGLISSVGAFPVRRGGTDIAGLKEAIDRLRQGRVVALFPEGTRSQTGQLGGGHIGAAFLAAKARVKIVPAFVRGTDKAWGKNSVFITPRPISVSFGPALETARILPRRPGRGDYERFTRQIMDSIGYAGEREGGEL